MPKNNEPQTTKWRFDLRSYTIGIVTMGTIGPFFEPYAKRFIDWLMP